MQARVEMAIISVVEGVPLPYPSILNELPNGLRAFEAGVAVHKWQAICSMSGGRRFSASAASLLASVLEWVGSSGLDELSNAVEV